MIELKELILKQILAGIWDMLEKILINDTARILVIILVSFLIVWYYYHIYSCYKTFVKTALTNNTSAIITSVAACITITITLFTTNLIAVLVLWIASALCKKSANDFIKAHYSDLFLNDRKNFPVEKEDYKPSL